MYYNLNMLKNNSLKGSILKICIGLFFSFVSSYILVSLISFDNNDPRIYQYNDEIDLNNIQNYLGYYGALISSGFLIILGTSSYFFGIFLFINAIKYLMMKNKIFFVTRLILLIIGSILINFIIVELDFSFYKIGLISQSIIELSIPLIDSFLINKYFILFFKLVLFALGAIFIWFSLSLKITYLSKLKFFGKIFKIFIIFKYINIFELNVWPKKKAKNKYDIKSEPTINSNNDKKIINKPSFANKINESNNKYVFTKPNDNLLNKASRKNNLIKEIEKANKESAIRLEKTLLEYGVEGKIINYKTGPIVTLFEFVPKAGIKSSKVIGLSDDIARAMSSYSARISSQPGKTSLGIEIPNLQRESVFFGDLVDDIKFKNSYDSLTLALGKNISGEKVFADLEKMPHLLIAGTTGSGKSVGINTMILSLLLKFKPNECKMILIDPKMLELSVYEDIPHLLTPVVTNPNKAVFALKWVVKEMENRYKLMSSLNVKNITSYNLKVSKTISSGKKLFREVQTGIDSETRMPIIEKREIALEKMPYIVVVIDEMADLMMVAGKEVETLVQRLAQMARASGIHLITATQRPSVDVITGTIKANFPCRISYKVASKFDSRTILNEMGAEQLLGSGDMLLLENGTINRLHGGYVTENEVEKIVNFIKSQATFDRKKEISLDENDRSQNSLDLMSNSTDELYSQAVNIVIKQQKVSTSYIQRYLQIGYNRAARIIEKMEEDGIISEANNAGKRHVLKKN